MPRSSGPLVTGVYRILCHAILKYQKVKQQY